MNRPFRVVLAEDHPIVREGLRAVLSSCEDLDVVGEAVDGGEAIRLVQSAQPDLVILDVLMPRMNGVEALREIKRLSPKARVVVLTAHGAEESVLAALRAGADAYVLKDSGLTELLLAVRSVLAGKRYLCPQVAPTVIAGYLGSKEDGAVSPAFDHLSDREKQVLKLVAEGYRNQQIADYLCISVKTVEKHRASLMKKLNLNTPSALTAYALERGLVSR